MVECEFIPVTAVAPALYSFNRYMVECEYSCCVTLCSFLIVLIDTWWNVNQLLEGAVQFFTAF